MNTFTSRLENDFGHAVDLRSFWDVALTWEQRRPQHGCEKYNPLQALRLRYWPDGSIAHSWQEIGDFYGIKREYARVLVHKALRELRGPKLRRHIIAIHTG